MAKKKMNGVHRADQYWAERPDVIQVIPGFNIRSELLNVESLKESIKTFGLKDALWVRHDPANDAQPFILIDGERRLTALRQLYAECLERGEKWEVRIPLQIFNVDADGAEDLMAMALLEREQISVVDEARLVARWLDRGFSISEIAAKLNMSPPWVEQRKLFATVDPQVKVAVATGKLALDAALDLARKVQSTEQGDVLTEVLKEAKGKRGAARRAVAAKTGTALRPGKKDVKSVVQYLTEQDAPTARIPAKVALQLVVDALKYGTGQISKEAFLQLCTDNLTAK